MVMQLFRRTMHEKEQKLAYHAPQYYKTLSNPRNVLRNTEEYKDDRRTSRQRLFNEEHAGANCLKFHCAHSPRDFISFAAGSGNGSLLFRFCGTFKAYYKV